MLSLSVSIFSYSYSTVYKGKQKVGVLGLVQVHHIRHLDSRSCNACDWEMTTLTGPVYERQRLGFDFVASPRHADAKSYWESLKLGLAL